MVHKGAGKLHTSCLAGLAMLFALYRLFAFVLFIHYVYIWLYGYEPTYHHS